jgi:hypothetical protein
LGQGYLSRHKSSGQNEDLSQSLLNLTEAILLPFWPSGKFNVHFVDILFHLASALLRRAKVFKQLIDANSAIQYFHHLRDQPLENSDIVPNEVTISLIEALACRAELGSSDGVQDINDIIAICHELFDLDISESLELRASRALRIAIDACGDYNGPVLDHCIKLLRQEIIRRPNSPAFSDALALSLTLRFKETLADDDFNEATTMLYSSLGSPPLGDPPDIWQQLSSATLLMLLGIRSATHGKPEHGEESMSHIRYLLRSSFLPDELRPDFVRLLQRAADARFASFGVQASSSLQEALSLNFTVVGPSAFLDVGTPRGGIGESHSTKIHRLTKLEEVDNSIRDLQGRFSAMVPGTSGYRRCLKEIVVEYHTKFSLTNDPMDIDKAIQHCRLLLDSTPPGGITWCRAALSLAQLYILAFEGTHKTGDLDESMGLLVGVLKVPAGQSLCDRVVEILMSMLPQRIGPLLDNPSMEAIQTMKKTMQTVNETFRLASDNKYTSAPGRLRHSCMWAQSLRYFGLTGLNGFPMIGSISTAYDKAMSLMQESVMFAPNLQLQHSHLVAMLQVTEKMPPDYASHLVDTGELTRAIEILERGRALLWSELRGLRTSTHNIAVLDPILAEQFTAVNRDLEKLTMSILPNSTTEVNYDEVAGGERTDPFGELLTKQRRLREERDSIISRARSFPGMQNFLMAPSFDTLRSAASHGPVIVINHSKWRSDILILYGALLSLIPTPKSFHDEGNKLRDDLLDARKKRGLDSTEYNRALASVLLNLYNLVGRPVIDRLRKLNVPEQSRIWWCPTSVFCSLPLHAMGPVPSHDGVKRYFSDLYIPSYTPTLSALIDSRNPGPQLQSPKQPSLLLVAQPGRSLPGVKGEIKVIQALEIEVESLILKDATTTTVLEGLRRHELVHFACHGNLEIGKPFDASFKLHGNQRLKLLDIVHSRLPTAECAFLSACHTAELTEDSIADEGLHLTAALQYCGFRSVVGTMWAMADTDGRDLARRVYRSMLTGNNDEPCYLRSAEALRDAVRELRDTNGVGLERWVNFVHYGA